MKRILCLIESLGSGGAERQLSGLAVMLKQRGYEVEVWYYIKQEFYLPFLKENGVCGRYLSDAAKPWKRYFVLRKHIKTFKPEAIISYSASPSMIACLLKCLGLAFHLIVSERSTTQTITNRVKLRFFLYRWASHIVPNSSSQEAFIKQQFPKLKDKVSVIHNYVDTGLFTPLADELPLADETKIICVGRLVLPKNIPNFILAIAKVINKGYKVKVDWFGQDLYDDYSSECYKTLKEQSISNVFTFHEPSAFIQEEYTKADVFCLPSIYEGFPNVLCEAMSCGLPVLCSDVCDNPNIIQDGENGLLFDPYSVEDIADTIIRFINLDIDTKKTMGQKSRQIALSCFSPDSFVNKYIDIL